MTAIKALILGLIQGIAEFLPISSSGHLELAKDLLGLQDVPILFDVILHIATLLVVVMVFEERILGILKALWAFLFHKGKVPSKGLTKTQKKKDEETKVNLAYVIPLLVATAVTAILGFVIYKYLPWNGVKAVSIQFLITAVVLGATAMVKPGTRGPAEIGLPRSLLVGLAQGLGVVSGISRSGMTISAGLLSGLDRETAGEFSFLLAIPAILGAFLISLKDLNQMAIAVSYGQLAIAFFAAMASGYVALKFLMKVIKGGKIYFFAPYLIVVGVLGLIFG
ncbi:MAG: undecaprenyl-diphosphate phosphatase [Spirochaetes bacterium]|nr:undecaprenyl-diphosphate phosphatase [Spirochaetota bacterium]